MFRDLARHNRCLVPASGFYEWKGEGTRVVPYYFLIRGIPVFSFAGLFDIRRDANGQDHYTFTIITTRANGLVRVVHDRMPVILNRDDESGWLSDGPLTHASLSAFFAPFPPEQMTAVPVSPRVNTPGIDDETLIRPLQTLL